MEAEERTKKDSDTDTTIPLLDLALWHTAPDQFAAQLGYACHVVGFFLLRHHIDPSITSKCMNEARQFFARPLEEKRSVSYQNSPAFRGYMELGVENTAGLLDQREQVEYAVEEEAPRNEWPPYERLRGPNPWPDQVQPSLRPATTDYVEQALRVADCLQKAMSKALGLEPTALDSLFQGNDNRHDPPHWVLKLISYPPSSNDDDTGFGVGAHTDTNFLTMILQDDIGGLQVLSKNGVWINVPRHYGPSVLVCNLGEQAELLTAGYFKATPHRVLQNRAAVERISIPLFYNPPLTATIVPISLPASLPWEASQDERRQKHKAAWSSGRNDTMLATVGDNTFKSLARSHPEVFRRHHGDLILLDDGRIVPKYGYVDNR